MEKTSIFRIFLLTLLLLNTPTSIHTLTSTISPSKPPTITSTLDPKQLTALQSLNIPASKDPCSNPASAICDNSTPFRHLTTLRLINCSDDVSLSFTALKALNTLQQLSFVNCPASAVRFPTDLATNLLSFTCINSLRKLTGVWLSKLGNVTDLTVSSVPIKASGPVIILGNLKKLSKVTLSNTNLTGVLPRSWHQTNITHIDLSGNHLKGKIPSSITELENLASLNLSSNQLTGELPSSIGDLLMLKNLSVSSNSLSGSIPESLAAMPELEQLDLSSNQFNGTIPSFINKLKALRYLNLEKNNFQGIMPFNGSFIKKLEVFKIGENVNLCYNHSTISAKVKLGIAPCDKNGLPLSPPAAPVPSGDEDSSDNGDSSSQDDTSSNDSGHHGPNKFVLGIAIALSSIVFLIVFLILLSRRCA